MTTPLLNQEAQKLAPSALIELYELDTSALTNIYGQGGTGTVYHWTSGVIGSSPLTFGGVAYQPMPIEATGFEWSGQGKLPTPRLKISNIDGLAAGLIYQFGDILGAQVTRIRTFVRFLDGQPGADSSAMFEPDVFRVSRKSAQNKAFVEFELSAELDQMGVRLPKRQAIADACNLTYRKWKPGAGWVFGTCPYNGSGLFDAGDQAVGTESQDICGHRLSSCLKRYGDQPLPFGGFPGTAHVLV